MLNIEMTHCGGTCVLRMTGHAGQADVGRDIVCAAASILCYTAAQTALDLHERGMLRKKPRVDIGKGDATVTLCPRQDAAAEVTVALRTVATGFALLAHHYPEYVTFRREPV